MTKATIFNYFYLMEKSIQQIRSFNRYYTKVLGLLEKNLLKSNYSLLEARIIYEINSNKKLTSSKLKNILNLDKGYLSRTLKKIHKKGLINKVISEQDKRQAYLEPTPFGIKEFKILNDDSDSQINVLTNDLTKKEVDELVFHMDSIKKILSKG